MIKFTLVASTSVNFTPITDLVEIIFRLPYTKRQFLIDAGLGTPKTVGNYLSELETAGFLTSKKVGKEKLYLNTALMNILESNSLG